MKLATVMDRKNLYRIVVGSLRETINTHGPITNLRIGSATKRIVGKILALQRENKNNVQNSSIRRRRTRKE